MTNLEIYGQAKLDAKTSIDFLSEARHWYNEAVSRMSFVLKNRKLRRWTSIDQDSDSPNIPVEFHNGIANYITSQFWLVKRQRPDMAQEFMDKFELCLLDLEHYAWKQRLRRHQIKVRSWT